MTTSDLVAGNLDQAVNALANRFLEKRADMASALEDLRGRATSALSGMRDSATKSPELAMTLAGAGVGAGLGGLRGLQRDEFGERRGVLRSALTGGLAGGAIGAGAGAVHAGIKGWRATQPGSSASASMKNVPPGIFHDPYTGKKMQISPEALKANPDLADRLRDIDAPSWSESAWDVGSEATKGAIRTAPLTTLTTVPNIALDVMRNNQDLAMGDSKSKLWPLGGMIDPKNTTMPEHLRAGLHKAVGDELKWLPGNQRDMLQNHFKKDPDQLIKDLTAIKPGGKFKGTRLEQLDPLLPPREVADTIPHSSIREMFHAGVPEKPKSSTGTGTAEKVRLQRGRSGAVSAIPSEMSVGRVGKRVLRYGAAPMADLAINYLSSTAKRHRSVAEIIAELRKQNLIKEMP